MENIVKVTKRLNLKPPEYSKPGSAVKELYEAKEFREIEEHLELDLRIVRWLDLYGAKKLIKTSVKEGLFVD